METFVQKTVFNPDLVGAAIRLKGYAYDDDLNMDGNYLVKESGGEYLVVIDHKGHQYTLSDEDFKWDNEDPEDDKWHCIKMEIVAYHKAFEAKEEK